MASATIQYNIHSYHDAVAVLKSRGRKKIGNNTYLVRLSPERIGVKYHNTYIVMFEARCALYTSGGWHTYTTKDRLNQLLPNGWGIYQKKYHWYLSGPDKEMHWFDGIQFLDGKVV